MRFVPIPTSEEALRRSAHIWLPFIPRIADRSDETVDEKQNKARAVIGISYRKLGRELVAELHWAAGFGMKDWEHLLPQVEQYLKEHVHCTISKPICRPGWKPLLKKHGYKQTHVVMEKML